ncbi:MAG: hypothetical protein OXC57_12040 [Rhodobacteraceae bacterium]|nr:hypothetical protein [Paracoccaceae bacterium]
MFAGQSLPDHQADRVPHNDDGVLPADVVAGDEFVDVSVHVLRGEVVEGSIPTVNPANLPQGRSLFSGGSVTTGAAGGGLETEIIGWVDGGMAGVDGKTGRCAYEASTGGSWQTVIEDGVEKRKYVRNPRPQQVDYVVNSPYTNGPIGRQCGGYITGEGSSWPNNWELTGNTITLTVRVYGKVYDNTISVCNTFGPNGKVTPGGGALWTVELGCAAVNNYGQFRTGYSATFRPGPGCAPAEWPTVEAEAAVWEPFARWCDFRYTVDGS